MKLWFFIIYIFSCTILFGQNTPERRYIDSIIQNHCIVCLKKQDKTFSKLEYLFHKSHLSFSSINDNERLVSIMKATELAKLSKDDQLLFFYIF